MTLPVIHEESEKNYSSINFMSSVQKYAMLKSDYKNFTDVTAGKAAKFVNRRLIVSKMTFKEQQPIFV